MILETIDNCFGTTLFSFMLHFVFFTFSCNIVNLFIYTLYYDIKVTFFFTGRVPEVFGLNFIIYLSQS